MAIALNSSKLIFDSATADQVWQIDFQGANDHPDGKHLDYVTTSVDFGYGSKWYPYIIQTPYYGEYNPFRSDLFDSYGGRTGVDLAITGRVGGYNTGEGSGNRYIWLEDGTYVAGSDVSLLADHLSFASSARRSSEITMEFQDLEAGTYEITFLSNYSSHDPHRDFVFTVDGASKTVRAQDMATGITGEIPDINKNFGTITNITVGSDGLLKVDLDGVPDYNYSGDYNEDPSIAGIILKRLNAAGQIVDEPAVPMAPVPEPESPDLAEGFDDEIGSWFARMGTIEVNGNGSKVINLDHDVNADWSEATFKMGFNANSTSGIQGLMSKDASGYSGGGNHVSAYIENGTLKVRLQDGEKDVYLSQSGIRESVDYDLALSIGNGKASLYLNGIEVDSTTQSDIDLTDNVENIQFGALGWSSQSGGDDFRNAFNGSISDLLVTPAATAPTAPALEPKEEAQVPNVIDPVEPVDPVVPDDIPSAWFSALDRVNVYGNASNVVSLSHNEDVDWTEVTFAMEFNASSTQGYQGLISKDATGYSGGGNHFSAYIENGFLKVRLQDGESDVFLFGSRIDTGTEHGLAVTFSDEQVTLYQDGRKMDETSRSNIDLSANIEVVQFGALGWSSQTGESSFKNEFDGSIANMMIFDRAFGIDQIESFL